MDDNNSDTGESMHSAQVEDTMQSNAEGQAAAAAPASEATADDGVGEHKLYAILGYILPFLFFLPLVQESSKNNAFARFHANQQLILLIVWVGVQFILGNVLYMTLGMGAYTLMPILNLAILVLAILGIIHAAQGNMKELPIVGKFQLVDKLFK